MLNDESINKYAVEGNVALIWTQLCPMMNWSLQVQVCEHYTGSGGGGGGGYFLYKISVKNKLYNKMTDRFTNHFAYVILKVSN